MAHSVTEEKLAATTGEERKSDVSFS